LYSSRIRRVTETFGTIHRSQYNRGKEKHPRPPHAYRPLRDSINYHASNRIPSSYRLSNPRRRMATFRPTNSLEIIRERLPSPMPPDRNKLRLALLRTGRSHLYDRRLRPDSSPSEKARQRKTVERSSRIRKKPDIIFRDRDPSIPWQPRVRYRFWMGNNPPSRIGSEFSTITDHPDLLPQQPRLGIPQYLEYSIE
jgi:hypothetical protein